MAYSKKTWVDRNVEHPSRRKLSPISGEENTYDVVRAEGTITEPGDAFNAETMNDLEGRIAEGIDSKQTKNLYFYNQSVETSAWESLETPVGEDYKYKANIALSGVTENHFVTLVPSQTTNDLGILSIECESYDGGVTIYAKEIPEVDITFNVIKAETV